MKSILKITTVIAFLFSTAMGMAKEPMLLLTKTENAGTLVFKVDTPDHNTAIRFFDGLGNNIYSEKTGLTPRYAKKFDLKNLSGGLYYFEVEDTFKEIVFTIEISKSNARIVNREEKIKPVFVKKGNKLYLNLLNLESSNVEIKVLDSSNRVLYKQLIEGEMVVEKAINFERAYEDSYTVVVKTGDDTYYENVLVD